MKLDRKEIAKLLNINKEALKQIERRKTLDKRLQEIGYNLIKKYIRDNKTFYELEKIVEPNSKQKINKEFRVKKTDNFINYFNERTDTTKPNSIGDLVNKVDVNKNTIIKWDNTLENKKILSKDGYFYFRLEANELFQVTKEEYSMFWKNKAYIAAFKDLQNKYIKGQLTLMQLQLASAEIGAIINTIENKYYFKVKKYKVNENNKLYIDIKNLIGGTVTRTDNK
jgi:hypothetical protein